MNSITLHQHGFGFTKMEYIIEDDGLRIIRKALGSSSDQKIDYEEIGSKITSAKTSKIIWFYLSSLFCLSGIVMYYFYVIIAIAIFLSGLFFFLMFMISKKSSIMLSQQDHSSFIEFIHVAKETEMLRTFLDQLIEKRNMVLKEKYMKLDNLLPFNQQYSNLIWLYELKLISREDLQKKIVELEGMGIPLEGEERPGDRIHITGFTKRKDDDLKH